VEALSDDRWSNRMFHRRGIAGARHFGRALAVIAVLILLSASARAQGPQFDVGAPPGAAGGASTVGQPLGAANFPDPDTGPSASAPISGRAGPGGTHVLSGGLSVPGAPAFRTSNLARAGIQEIQPLPVPSYGDLDLPAGELDYGPPNGMTLDAAIEILIKQNLDLEAARLEVPMSQADLLTASLRANPIFYADQQLVPYGHYSFLRPGGPQQSDLNVNYPLDITRKRHARTQSAAVAKKVTEAQLQDAIRTQIDNLYTVYVGVIAAGLTERFSQVYADGIRKLLQLTEQLFNEKQVKVSDVLAVKANLEKAELQVRESKQAKYKANQALALMLNLPLTDLEKLDVHDPIGTIRELPLTPDALVTKGLQRRPDLLAIKLGVIRSEKDVMLARANAYPDVYLLWQPYTFQNNTYLGVQSAYSWTLGVTATVPLYNRNQGNILRARINVTQTQIQAKSRERGVVSDVLNAIREYEQSRLSVIEMRKEILPASKKVREAAFTRFQGGETSALEYLDAQQGYNDVVRQYRDTLVRYRNAMLDLNTAVAERVVP
jgi:cobalt-zinc-cadmium efflux system outer membrane protein